MAAIGDGWADGAWVEAGWVTGANPAWFTSTSSISVDLTGTVTTATEEDISAGGNTIILELVNDTWVALGATFDAQRQAIIDGLDSSASDSNGWNAEVRDKEVVTAVVRTSPTVVTITLSAAADYNISASESITATIPASALVLGALDVVATPSFIISSVSAGGGRSLTLRQMKDLERRLLLEQIRGDDELVVLLLSQSMTRRNR